MFAIVTNSALQLSIIYVTQSVSKTEENDKISAKMVVFRTYQPNLLLTPEGISSEEIQRIFVFIMGELIRKT